MTDRKTMERPEERPSERMIREVVRALRGLPKVRGISNEEVAAWVAEGRR